MIALFVLLVIAIRTTHAVVFTCPTNPITTSILGGSIPLGATNLTLTPANTNCTFTFDIPNGYALLLQLSVDFKSDNDSISVIDNTQKIREIRHSGKVLNAPVWLAAGQAQIQVISVSGNSEFFATYNYKFLNNYTQVKKSTGNYFPLSLLSNKNYFTFFTAPGEKVVATVGKKTSGQIDGALSQIFVYDGDDISTSKMVGTLEDFGSSTIMTSSNNSLTLVNFYGTKSPSYVIGNDASTLDGFFKYSVIMTTSGTGISGTLGDLTGLVGGYTFICTDCNRFYITKFDFDGLVIIDSAYTKFQGQTPTHQMEKLITYSPATYMPEQMPQLIPSGIFTLSVHLSKIIFNINTVNDDFAWKSPYHGRKGYIFSTNLWNPAVIPNNFNYEFRNESQLYTYSVNAENMSFGLRDDKMTLQIGTGYEEPVVDNQYSRDQTSTENVSAVGTYLKIGLNGSANDDIRLSFEMNMYSSAASLGILSSMILTLFNFF